MTITYELDLNRFEAWRKGKKYGKAYKETD